MTECARLSDRMPLVALGRLNWTLEEDRHLRECASCRAEWTVVSAGARLGHHLTGAADPSRLARSLLDRLDLEGKRRRRRVWSYAGLAAAATVLGLLWSKPPAQPPATAPVRTMAAALQIPLPELDGLQPEELDSVLQAIDAGALEAPALKGLKAAEPENEAFESVLDYWEG